jgi:ribosome-associated protein
MTASSTAKKDTQRLQRAIVEGLEDVKGQDIRVFNTEHLSPLFERVIVASGTSNRQTKALASSVIDAVREAGFAKPRIEGQDNGEWIIVDCGAAVAHIMQPAIRTYYQLEEIWGDKPVRLKVGAPSPTQPVRAAKTAAREPVSLRRSSAVKVAERAGKAAEQAASQAAGKSARKAAGKAGTKTTRASAQPGSKAPRASAKPGVKSASTPTAKSAPRKAAATKATPRKAPAKKAAPRKA